MMRLAIFDFDGTLFTQETLPFLLRAYKQLKYPPIPLFKCYLRLIFLWTQYKGLKKMTKEIFRNKAMVIFSFLFENMTKEEILAFFKAAQPLMEDHYNERVLQALK